MKRFQWIGLLLAAVLVLLAGCTQEEDSADGGAAEQENTEVETDTKDEAVADSQGNEEQMEMAKTFIEQLNEGKFEGATEKFDETMNEQVTAADLEGIWKDLNSQIGNFIEQEFNKVEEADGYQVVLITGIFNDADVTFQVTFDENQQIAGFYVQ
ncbi:DUF3887 domain-containing protein [Oceanobacillus sp. FSL H7-0719]|uniref:DUF3887 domain-containing protein n=1 Tax=Oceanobacillus sp. FSL H7-0719 TaxID=2954507 RepID=UPI0032539E67